MSGKIYKKFFFQNNLNKNLSEMYEFKILYDTHAINLN